MLMRTQNNEEYIDNVLMNMRAMEKEGFRFINNNGRN